MASAIVAAPTDAAWLAERGLAVGARVGSCVVAHAPLGTVIAVTSVESITVRWDNGQVETVGWTAISPLGYVVGTSPITASASQWASAAAHLDLRADWRTVRIDGVRYVVLTSGNSGRVYHVRADAGGCKCRWYEKMATRCSHALAVELAALEDELSAAPAWTVSASFPSCRVCGEATDGARRLCDRCCAEQTRRLEIASRTAAVAA
jgi:hypothetical protein